MELHKILDQSANEYFLGIDDDVEEDDDTIHGSHNTTSPKTTDTFHPVVSVDVGTAKMIQNQHQKEKKQSLEKEDIDNASDQKQEEEEEEEEEEEPTEDED